ncbi:hypothetical protein Pta02_63460 [Planobispora takensis]|uniref:Uncharacterized protein n=1 Tax=Planobispora takensis TaxID=1367882 RepID=A0A8J3T513_9ACTN|nr:hypothetical protein Pta02_63460 [Planobispora takensis]
MRATARASRHPDTPTPMPPWMIRGSLSGGAAPVDGSAIVTGETSCSAAVRLARYRPGTGAGEIQPGRCGGGVVTKVPKAEVAGHLRAPAAAEGSGPAAGRPRPESAPSRTSSPGREAGPSYWTENRTVPTATNAAPVPMSTAPRPIAREVTCQAW